ncbi:MucR family transcriptional regulator [Methylobacterium fujisawaense]|uniref:MucR family transcriptional regulator n=1 Tax=Methylobacterium fujisawaense TaxID=107400 RepID=UPI002F330963
MDTTIQEKLQTDTVDIVSSYVARNPVQLSDLPKLISTVHESLAALGSGPAAAPAAVQPEAEKPTPAQIKKSVQRDGIVSFIDGKSYKTLKRHLTSHGLDERAYRERYGLPSDYPMTAPSYSEQRSALAKALGLGRPGATTEAAPAPKGRKAAA